MDTSDDFDIDDHDTEWLAVATQVEASQGGIFEPSPRPWKRRKAAVVAEDQSGGLKAGDDDEYYLPGELDEDFASKKSRHKIHIPDDNRRFSDLVVTQTQHGLDDDPTALRGPIWKRPLPLAVRQQGPAEVTRIPATKTGAMRVGINSYFVTQSVPGRRHPIEDDAMLAARLQREEQVLLGPRSDAHFGKASINAQSAVDLTQDLADLPSDAFSSPLLETCSAKQAIPVSSGGAPSQPQVRGLRGPQTGLKQMTMMGLVATQDIPASQAAKKRHAWPLKSKDESPTHHKLDEDAMKTWVYPTNLGAVRDYQFNIVSRSLFHNTLVALPTGLGKTFIAAAVMLNYYRWTTESQIVFMAPTKPLIAQQMEACYGIAGISRRDTVLMTGETSPGLRTNEWLERRVFFMTPQTVINDLKTGICDPKKIVLIVVDEAHKATGAYAYTEVTTFIRRFNPSFRVLALTATPGSTVEAVQAVIDNLGISRVELRTEQSLDIRSYTHEKQTEIELFEYSDEQVRIMDWFAKCLRGPVDKLKSHNAYFHGDPMALTAYGLTIARKKWMSTDAGRKAPKPVQGMINAAFQQLSKLAHSIMLLKNHGILPFFSGVNEYRKNVESGTEKGKTALAITQHESFVKMMSTLQIWINNPEFIGHPKLEYLREVVLNHFLDAGEGRQGSQVPPSATRIMIFASYRDSTEEICRVLKRNEPMIRPHVLVGQAASKGSEGMDQKRQNAAIQDFRTGKYNTLIATSIGEEGLDIGTVDLIICYDSSSSPIRMLQRIGRTGRKRMGRVVLLLMKGKEESDYAKSQDNYLYIQKTIADTARYTYHYEQSPRILPKHVQPIVDKRSVEIPVENSQPVDFNEKSKKSRGKARQKRAPKKFHMPDGVRTTFVKASRLRSDEDEAEDENHRETSARAPAKAPATFKKLSTSFPAQTRARTSEPEAASLPAIVDVVLTPTQMQELNQKYARSVSFEGNDVIRAPDTSHCVEQLKALGPIRHVRHGRAATVQRVMQSIANIDERRVQQMKDKFLESASDNGSGMQRLASPWSDQPRLIRQEQHSRACGPVLTKERHSDATPEIHACTRADIVESAGGERQSLLPASKPNARRGRPRKMQSLPRTQNIEDSGNQVDPETERDRPQSKAPRRKPKEKQLSKRAMEYASSAQEGEESEPEPTPADMRIGTQGIDLGSRDTSGEDEDEEMDSDLADFIAGSSDPIEMVSSSQNDLPAPSNRRRLVHQMRRQQTSTLNCVEEASENASGADESGSSGPVQEVVSRTRKRRVLSDDSDGDE